MAKRITKTSKGITYIFEKQIAGKYKVTAKDYSMYWYQSRLSLVIANMLFSKLLNN